jgi:hypothetical protein
LACSVNVCASTALISSLVSTFTNETQVSSLLTSIMLLRNSSPSL